MQSYAGWRSCAARIRDYRLGTGAQARHVRRQRIAHSERRRSMFKTPQGQARYLAAYEATLALWPVTVESFPVPTRFGTTHVNACGPRGAHPVVLLHELGISGTMWYQNVADLSRSYRVYALDTIGDAGKSICTRSLRTGADFVAWLSDVFSHLELESAHVVGMSYGGFLSLT